MEIAKEIYYIFTPLLLGIVIYFLRGLLNRFDQLEKEVKEFLIEFAKIEQRVKTLEERLKEVETWLRTSSSRMGSSK